MPITELAGASAALLQVTAQSVFQNANIDEQMIEFERCHARVKIQERRPLLLKAIANLKLALQDCHTSVVNMGPELSDEDHTTRQAIWTRDHYDEAEKMLEAVLTLAPIKRRWFFLWLR